MSEEPNVPIVEIRCGLGARTEMRMLLEAWERHSEGAAQATVRELQELPIVERDSYPSSRFTFVDDRGNSVFVGSLRDQHLLS